MGLTHPLFLWKTDVWEQPVFFYWMILLCIRPIYHCPSCNLCRVGHGLGIDFYHCMKCNCCLGKGLVDHKCLEKALETNCPICCEFLFTSSATVRPLPCGHYMHSACFQVKLQIILYSMLLSLTCKDFWELIHFIQVCLSLIMLSLPGICLQ